VTVSIEAQSQPRTFPDMAGMSPQQKPFKIHKNASILSGRCSPGKSCLLISPLWFGGDDDGVAWVKSADVIPQILRTIS
jgi:hypothetical protein